MTTRTRILFWLILLCVGLQWIGDPVDTRLTGGQSLAAGWHDSDANGPDNSHHYGVALLEEDLTPSDHATLVSPVLRLTGPALFGWLLPASDSPNLRHLAISHQTPRAPPAA